MEGKVAMLVSLLILASSIVPSGTQIAVSVSPTEVLASAGDTVSFTCTSQSPLGLTWAFLGLDGGDDLSGLSNIDNIINGTSQLTIDPVTFSDAGYYVCRSVPPFPGESEHAVLIVSPEGSVNVTPSRVNADIGDVVSFTCSAEGGPGNQFSWIRRHISATVVGNTAVLVIDGVTATDGGVYECSVENLAGSGTNTAILHSVQFVVLCRGRYTEDRAQLTVACSSGSSENITAVQYSLNTGQTLSATLPLVIPTSHLRPGENFIDLQVTGRRGSQARVILIVTNSPQGHDVSCSSVIATVGGGGRLSILSLSASPGLHPNGYQLSINEGPLHTVSDDDFPPLSIPASRLEDGLNDLVLVLSLVDKDNGDVTTLNVTLTVLLTNGTLASIEIPDIQPAQECSYNGHTYLEGDAFAANDTCNICACVNGSVSCTKETCPAGCVYNETLYTHQQFFSDGPCIECLCFNGTPICEDVCPQDCDYGGQIYRHGSTFPTGDDCNYCQCFDGAVKCTSDNVCSPDGECHYDGFTYPNGAVFSDGPCLHCYCTNGNVTCDDLCGPDCYFYGAVYADNETFPAHDGCNNCTCASGRVTCTDQACFPAIELWFVNNTPLLSGGSVYAEFEASLPGLLLLCHVTRLDSSDTRHDCSSGSYSRTDLETGVFTLRVVALDPATAKKLAVLHSRLRVHSEDASDPYCITYLVNRGWRVEGDTFTVEFAATGAASGFQCSLDRAPHVPCESPFRALDLSPGEHHFRVQPRGCGQHYRVWNKNFYISTSSGI